jgi:hypothetical protein
LLLFLQKKKNLVAFLFAPTPEALQASQAALRSK